MQIYDISTGFCSVDYWTRVIKENVFNLIYKIYEELWDTYPFDFEQYETLLIKKLRNMSLFSVSLHFLRCRRSCENKPAYCRFCSRVRENDYYEYNAFWSIKETNNEYLNIQSYERVDFDVFLNKPAYMFSSHCEDAECDDCEVFTYVRDLFAAFSSVFIKLYLNYTVDCFQNPFSQVSLQDESRIIKHIFFYVRDLLLKFHDVDYDYFYEFFDLSGGVNASKFYISRPNKPKYGLYDGPKYSIEIGMF